MALPATFTVLGTRKLTGKLWQRRVSVVLDNAYPVAGYALTPAQFGFASMELNDAQTAYIDPTVTGVNQSGILAEIKGMQLLLSFPTGGAGTSPAVATTAPVGATGATTVTSSAATVPLVPGAGKACANGMDASSVTLFISATGYFAV